MAIRLDDTTQQALERLITVAQADTGQSAAVPIFCWPGTTQARMAALT